MEKVEGEIEEIEKEIKAEIKAEKFVENVDYYFDDGLMVLTECFLRKRGYCCRNDCRHCPYQNLPENGESAQL